MRIITVDAHDENGQAIETRNAQAAGRYVRIVEEHYNGEPGQAAGAIWDSLPQDGGHWIIHNDAVIATR